MRGWRRQGLQLSREAGADGGRTAKILNNTAVIHFRLGDVAAARKAMAEAMAAEGGGAAEGEAEERQRVTMQFNMARLHEVRPLPWGDRDGVTANVFVRLPGPLVNPLCHGGRGEMTSRVNSMLLFHLSSRRVRRGVAAVRVSFESQNGDEVVVSGCSVRTLL